jgi:hypothetical protein
MATTPSTDKKTTRSTRAKPKGTPAAQKAATTPSTDTTGTDTPDSPNVASSPPVVADPKVAALEARNAELQRQLDAVQNDRDAGLRSFPDDATERDVAIAKLMDNRDHLRNCPAVDGTELRVEMYGDTIPARPHHGVAAKACTVVRCITCGGTTRIDEPIEQVSAAL